MSSSVHAAADRAIAESAPATAFDETPHAWLILLTTILASSLAFIDSSVVNVGLPAIGNALSVVGGRLTWIVNGYLLPLGALLLIGGAAGDLYGRRRLLIVGTVLFAVASALCSLAPDFSWLLVGRAVQGVGAALLMPNSLAILGASFAGKARGRAIGFWAAAGAATGAGGPLLGGWLIDAFGWRAIFFVNLPIAALVVLLAARYVPSERETRDEALDWVGGMLATVTLGVLTWGLTQWSETRHIDSGVVGAGVVGVMSAGAFIATEKRLRERAMLPLSLFSSTEFVGLTLLTLLLYGALGAMVVLIPYTLIKFLGYSATAAGAALLPLPLMLAFVSPSAGALSARIGARLPLSIGPIVAGAGCLLVLRFDRAGSYWVTVLPALLVIALGMAGAVAPLTTAVLNAVDQRHNGVASGFNSATARTGGLIATALLGGVLGAQGVEFRQAFAEVVTAAAVAAFISGVCGWFALANSAKA